MAIKRIRRLKSQRLTKPNVLSFVAYTLILFFGTTILVNINPNANEQYRSDRDLKHQKALQWVFLGEDGISHDLFAPLGDGMHGSADDFDYLLPQKEGSDFVSGQDVSHQDEGLSSVIKQPKKAYNELWHFLEDRSVLMGIIFEYLLRGDIVELPDGAARYLVFIEGTNPELKEKAFQEKSCMTPWGYEIEHWASLLAYQQRDDASHVCNIQRRVCKNGKLSGTFIQASCDERAVGNSRKLPYHVYNNQVLDEFIQPPQNARYHDADFTVHGKRENSSSPSIIPWVAYPQIHSDNEVPLSAHNQSFCVAPWWERVEAGQFTKAYRFQNGFTDIPCKVQLRLCVNGKLEGNYYYPNCHPWSTSYEDFLEGYMNGEQPSPQRLLRMLNTEIKPSPEYWNNLEPEIIDRLLKLLRE